MELCCDVELDIMVILVKIVFKSVMKWRILMAFEKKNQKPFLGLKTEFLLLEYDAWMCR